jgi:hypothetical protein
MYIFLPQQRAGNVLVKIIKCEAIPWYGPLDWFVRCSSVVCCFLPRRSNEKSLERRRSQRIQVKKNASIRPTEHLTYDVSRAQSYSYLDRARVHHRILLCDVCRIYTYPGKLHRRTFGDPINFRGLANPGLEDVCISAELKIVVRILALIESLRNSHCIAMINRGVYIYTLQDKHRRGSILVCYTTDGVACVRCGMATHRTCAACAARVL